MAILITGGTGFLGRHLTRHLLQSGEKDLVLLDAVPNMAALAEVAVAVEDTRLLEQLQERLHADLVPVLPDDDGVLVLDLELVNEASQVFHRPEVFPDEGPIPTFFASPYGESRWNLVHHHPRKLLDADFGGFLDHDPVLPVSTRRSRHADLRSSPVI